MPVYNNPEGIVVNSIKPYIKYREKALVSNVMNFEDISYVEVVFYKKRFFKKSEEPSGYAYITLENPQNVEVPYKVLCEHAYFNAAFFSNLGEGGILDAFRNSEMDKYEENDLVTLYNGVEYLTSIGYEEVEIVRNVVEELKDMRDLNIDIFKNIDEIKHSVLIDKEIFTTLLRDSMYENYIKTLKLNYEKVKIIESYFDSLVKVQEIANEKMSMFESKFLPNRDFGIIAPLRKLKYEVNYYIRVVETYEKILKMDEQEYLNYVKELDNRRIEKRLKLIRK